MTTNVKIYRSTDPGAAAYTIYGNVPGSTGGAGGWIGVLRACLVNGYGSKTASSATSASTIVTFTSTAHGFIVGQCLLLAGATGESATPINGERYVTATTPDTFTFVAPGHADGATEGAITAKVAPAGWTEPYTPSTTNISCFKQGGGNGFYFNIDETAVQLSRVVGFESMTACNVTNGTAAFPTNTQFSGGLYWNRSDASSTATRAWIIIATDRHLYLHINATNSTSTTANDSMLAGMIDLKSYRTSDGFATLMMGGASAPVTTNSIGMITITNPATSIVGHFITRPYTQIGSSTMAGKNAIDSIKGTGVNLASAPSYGFPCPVDNGLWMSKIRAYDTTSGVPRGELPGLWDPMHLRPLVHLDTMAGSGDLAGKTFITLSGYPAAQCFIETSNTWSI